MRLGTTALLLPMMMVAGCVADPARLGGTPTPGPAGGADGGVECAHPEQGCACEPGRPAIDCYLDPITGEDGSRVCNAGTRYCRDGAWTACEGIREYVIAPTSGALVTGPDECNECDPRCFVSRDNPGPEDLTPERSSGVSYDADRGGIEITSLPPEVLTDSDSDGVPDIADECTGLGAFEAADGSCDDGRFLFHILPYGASATDALDISTQIRTADVYFLMDTTGSMGGELSQLQADLTSGTFAPGCTDGVMGAIRCTIPDAWFGVGYFDDYPFGSYGSTGDFVFRNVQDIAESLPDAQTAMNSLVIHSGGDGPESNTQALWALATGDGLESYLVPRTGCPAGRWGYPCFRDGTIPLVIHITDAPFHNGPADAYRYAERTIEPLPIPTPVSGNEASDASPHGVVDITGSWVGFTGDTSSMANDHDFGCGSGAADAVFRVSLSARRTVRFTTDGSDYDTVLGVFSVDGGGWCDDDSGPGNTSELELRLDAGEYYVVVDGYSTESGPYRLSMGRVPATTTFDGVSWDEAVTAISDEGIRVITVHTCGSASDPYCVQGETHARALGNATNSLGSEGSPYVFRGNANGTGLSATIVEAVLDLASYSRMDVTARAVGDTEGLTNLPITAVSVVGGGCEGISGGTTFDQCLPGTTVNFNVTFNNDAVTPIATAQVFSFFIEIVGDGTIVLARVPVRIVVPASPVAYPASGSYWRDHDSTVRCALNERPDWGSLTWNADIPAGTHIEFELRAANTAAALATATSVARITTPTAVSPIDVAAALRGAGYTNGMSHLRVTAVLYSNADGIASPALTSMEVTYSCLPAE